MNGKAKLFESLSGIPEGGLICSKLRIELFEQEKPAEAWISELTLMGDLPWFPGEQQAVKVRILTKEFRDHVAINRPDLIMRRGNQIIGTLSF